MGRTKELFEKTQEEEESQNSEYYDLIGRLQRKEETLSYSSLKAFSKSPRNFIQYKLKPNKQQTESQIFGSLCDCFLTTPDKFDEMFFIIKSIPSSDNQKSFCNDIFEGKTKEEAYANNYKTGGVDKVYETVREYVEAILSGKMICTKSMYDEAFRIIDNLKKSELIMQYIDSCNKFQNKKEWNYDGWKFKGFTDAEGIRLILDFKYSQDSDPDKFERDIVKFKYYLQAGMYSEANENIPDFYFVVYDKSLNFSLIKLDYSFISYGIREYKYLVAKLNQCIKENRWGESFNFWDVQQKTVFKPKWIKGFETDSFDIE